MVKNVNMIIKNYEIVLIFLHEHNLLQAKNGIFTDLLVQKRVKLH